MPTPGNAQIGGVFDPNKDVVITGQIVSKGPCNTPNPGGIGYADGAGGSVTQATNRTTGVTVNALCGTITTNNTSLAAEAAASFVVKNSTVKVRDGVILTQAGGAVGVMTTVEVIAVADGQFSIAVMNGNAAAGTAETGAIRINFQVIKGTIL
jgi:hypothetical protein